MLRLVRPLLLAVLLGVTACADQPSSVEPEDIPPILLERSLSIVDGVTGEGGNPGFKWILPIGDRLFFPGRGDGSLYPRIEVCPRNDAGDGCANAPLLVEFTRDDPDRDRRVSVDWRDQYYAVWRMNDVRPERGGIYRIRVMIGDEELGHADIIAVRRPFFAAFLRRRDADPIPVSDRGVFPIAFRIEDGALEAQFCDFDGDGDVQDCDAGVERPGDGQPTQVEVRAQGGDDDSPVAAVVTAPDGVFTDSNGVPIPDVVLTAEVEIVPPSDDIYPDNQELPFFVEVNTIPEDVYIDPNGPGVSVVICQDTPALVAKGVSDALHPQLILYKVGDNGVTKRLPSTYGAPECDDHDHGGGVGGMAQLLERGTKSLLEFVGPSPLAARRLHGGLNTVIRRPIGTLDAPFSTFGSALGPNAAQSSAVVPSTVLVGEVVSMFVEVRDALGNGVPFGGDVVSATVSGANAGAPVAIVDNDDGTYWATYTAASPGADQVDIVLDRQDIIAPGSIGGSPYTVTVQSAATGSLNVTATDGASALAGVAVTLTPGSFGATTNGNGVATFASLPPGSYTVSGSLSGFNFPSTNATVVASAAASASLTGTPSAGVISGTLPTSGSFGFGQMITVQGTGFPAGATVEFTQGGGPVAAQFTWSAGSTAMVVRSPPSGFVAGPVDITVTSSQGTTAPFTYTFTTVPAAPVLLEPVAGANVAFGAVVLVGGHGIDTGSSRYEVELVQGVNTVSIKGSASTGGVSGLPANVATMPASGGVFVPGPATIRMRVGNGGSLPYGPWASVNVNIVP